MLKLKSDFVGFFPLILIIGYILIRAVFGAAKYGGYPLVSAIGLLILFISAFIVVFIIFRSRIITRFLMAGLSIIILLVGILLSLSTEMKGLYILTSSCFYVGIYGIVILVDLAKISHKSGEVQRQLKELLRVWSKKKIISSLLITLVCVSGFTMTHAWRFDSRTELQFEISQEEMENKELVLYWVRQNLTNPQNFVDVLRDTNTVLALQGNPDLFQEIGDFTALGAEAANLVKLCNIAGVKVEVWPVPSQNNYCALSLRYVDCMPEIYGFFKDWLSRNNITVDYYAFDIEDYVPLEPFENSLTGRFISPDNPLYWTFRGSFEKAQKQQFLRTNRSNWDEIIGQQQALVDQIIADGMIPRGTIQPTAYDALDGDYKEFTKNFMQSYEITGYEYLSGMYYRSCEWGNNDEPYKVYQAVRIMDAVSPYEKTAVCIGCIAYPAYETDLSVANDVWVSVGAGADSVRLFLGDSWVYSAPTEAEGIDDLRSMLELCREGGIGITNYDSQWENGILGIIIDDIIADL